MATFVFLTVIIFLFMVVFIMPRVLYFATLVYYALKPKNQRPSPGNYYLKDVREIQKKKITLK